MNDFILWLILVSSIIAVFLVFEYRRRIFLKKEIKKGIINPLDPVFIASSRDSVANQIGNSFIVLGQKSLRFYEKGKLVTELQYADVTEVRCTQAVWKNEYAFLKTDGSVLAISTGAKVDTASASKRVGIALLMPFVGKRFGSLGVAGASLGASAALQAEAASQLNSELSQRGLKLLFDATASKQAAKKWKTRMTWSLVGGFFGTFLLLAIVGGSMYLYEYIQDAPKRAEQEKQNQALIAERESADRQKKLEAVTFQPYDTNSSLVKQKGSNTLVVRYDSKNQRYATITMDKIITGQDMKVIITQAESQLPVEGPYYCSRQEIIASPKDGFQICQTSTTKNGTVVYSLKDQGVSTGQVFVVKEGTLLAINLDAITPSEEAEQLNLVVDSLQPVSLESLQVDIL